MLTKVGRYCTLNILYAQRAQKREHSLYPLLEHYNVLLDLGSVKWASAKKCTTERATNFNMLHNAGWWCTTQFGGAQGSPVPLKWCSSHKPKHTDRTGSIIYCWRWRWLARLNWQGGFWTDQHCIVQDFLDCRIGSLHPVWSIMNV